MSFEFTGSRASGLRLKKTSGFPGGGSPSSGKEDLSTGKRSAQGFENELPSMMKFPARNDRACICRARRMSHSLETANWLRAAGVEIRELVVTLFQRRLTLEPHT